MDDAPAAEQRAQRHGRLAGDDHPEWHVKALAEITLRKQEYGDDAHGLLRVVAAVAEGIERGGDELHDAEGAIDGKRCLPHEDPRDGQHQHQRQEETDGRRHEDRCPGFQKAAPDDR